MTSEHAEYRRSEGGPACDFAHAGYGAAAAPPAFKARQAARAHGVSRLMRIKAGGMHAC
jgi:hypothetical protein